MNEVIAVDGPAASGKSTVSRRVAAALGYLYVDSGALYRGVTWAALQRGIDPHDSEALVRVLDEARFAFAVEGGAVCFRIDGVDPGQEIRTQTINANVSPVAATPEVRTRVVAWLRDMRRHGNLVMEGRDIGTVVFPDARHKFYLDASPDVRAQRRHTEIACGEAEISKKEIQESLRRRDEKDSGRKTAPLRIAAGARVIDSTAMGVEQVTACILDEIRGASDGGPT